MNRDAEQIAAVLRGENHAFTGLVQRHKNAVYGLAFSLLKDFEAARDVSQEAFLRAFLQLPRLEQPERFPAWLCAITANACRNWLRKPRETVGLEETDLEEKMNGRNPLPERPDERLERQEDRRLVSRALTRLSPENREILTLYYMGNRSSADIARYLDISPAAARQRLTRARGHLKEEILEMIDDVLKQEALGEDFEDEVQALMDQASQFSRCTEYGKELELLEKAHQIAPEDTAVTLILAGACRRGKSPWDLEKDPRPYHRACRLYEELIEREPGNLLVRIKLAELHSVLEPFDQLEPEHEEVLRLAEGTPFEPVALLRMARLYTPRRRHEQALPYLQRLIDLETPWTAVARSEMGISFCLKEEYQAAIEQFEEGIRFLEAQPPKYLREFGRSLFGERLRRYDLDLKDDRLTSLLQDHTWLAGLHARNGDPEAASLHLRTALDYLDREELSPIRPRMARSILTRIDHTFPELADEPEIQTLRANPLYAEET